MQVEEPVHFTDFQLHNNMEKEAAEFLGAMLREIRKTCKYGNMTKIDGQYQPHPDEAFKMLGAISNYIQFEVASGSSFPDKKHLNFFWAFDAAISDPVRVAGNVLNGALRNGIICFIWRLHDCIRYVEGKSQEELESDLHHIIHSYYTRDRPNKPQEPAASLRSSTKASTWSSTVNQWKEAVQDWTEFLSIYDSVFPRVFWDIPGTMQFMIEHYPRVFWNVFWPYVANPDSLFTIFRQYLVYSVVSTLVESAKGAQHLKLSDGGFERFMNAHRHEDFATVMRNYGLGEAMVATNTVMYPRMEDLGDATRSAMDMDMQSSAGRKQLSMPRQVSSAPGRT